MLWLLWLFFATTNLERKKFIVQFATSVSPFLSKFAENGNGNGNGFQPVVVAAAVAAAVPNKNDDGDDLLDRG